jgi:hypothetical protein
MVIFKKERRIERWMGDRLGIVFGVCGYTGQDLSRHKAELEAARVIKTALAGFPPRKVIK